MRYNHQSMQNYFHSFEETFTRLASMESAIAEDLQITNAARIIRRENSSPYFHPISPLQIIPTNLTWETSTAMIIQEFNERVMRSQGSSITHKADGYSPALYTHGRDRRHNCDRPLFRSAKEKRRCYRCGKVGHLIRNWRAKNWRSSGGHGNQREGQNVSEVDSAQQAQLFIANEVQNSNGFKPSAMTSTDSTVEIPENLFLLDSGVSKNMVLRPDWLEDVGNIDPKTIILGDGSRAEADHSGTLTLNTVMEQSGRHEQKILVLSEVLLIPKLHTNLISCSKLCEEGYDFAMNRNECMGKRGGELCFH